MKSGLLMQSELSGQLPNSNGPALSSAKIESKCAHCSYVYLKRMDRIRNPDFCSIKCRKSYHDKYIKTSRKRSCKTCGADFYPRQYQLSQGQGKYCSNECAIPNLIECGSTPEAKKRRLLSWIANGNREKAAAIKGPLHRDFAGKLYRGGYLYVWTADRGYIAKHRLVMERHLGRHLSESEIVHHKDRNRLNNRIRNLELMDRASHMLEHFEEISMNRVTTRRPQKLTEEAVLEIRRLAADGLRHVDLAKRFGCTSVNIGYVVRRKIWTHI